MKLILHNIGIIQHSEIAVDGITLIVGNNSTGKSTIGRALHLCCASLCGMNKYIQEDRQKTIQQELNKQSESLDLLLKESINAKRRRKVSEAESLRRVFALNLSNYSSEEIDSIKKSVLDYARKHASLYGVELTQKLQTNREKIYYNWVETTALKIQEVLQPEDEQIGKRRVSEKIERYFSGQIIHIPQKNEYVNKELEEEKSYIQILDENNLANKISFERNKKAGKDICSSFSQSFNIEHPAVYIENPRVLDKLPSRLIWTKDEILNELLSPNAEMQGTANGLASSESNFLNFLQNYLQLVIGGDDKAELKVLIRQDAIGGQTTLTQKEQYDSNVRLLEHEIDRIVGGHLVVNNPKGVQFEQDGLERNIEVSSLSTGIKSLSLLRFALENGCIQKGDTLIFDEPEINLHPEWQIDYAQIIVRLQHLFDLKIIITTHSPYFMQAMEYSSKLEGVADKYHCYLAESANGKVRISCVDDVPSMGYKKLVDAFARLEKMSRLIK